MLKKYYKARMGNFLKIEPTRNLHLFFEDDLYFIFMQPFIVYVYDPYMKNTLFLSGVYH